MQPLFQVIHRVAQSVSTRSQRDLRRVLHEVVFHAGERVPHAGGALLEFGVLVVRMVQLLLVMVSMLTAAVAAVVRYEWLICLKRVLIGVTKTGNKLIVKLNRLRLIA